MPKARHAPHPGLREVCLLWGLFLLVSAEIFATYARTPVHELYHVSENGRAAGAGRVVVFLNWPVALAVIAILPVVADYAESLLNNALGRHNLPPASPVRLSGYPAGQVTQQSARAHACFAS